MRFIENIFRFKNDLSANKNVLKFWPRLVTTVFVWTFHFHQQAFRVDPKTSRIDMVVFSDSAIRSQKIKDFIEKMVAEEEQLSKVMR